MPRLGQLASIFVATAAAAPLPGERDLTNYTYDQYIVEFNRGALSEQENSARKQIFEENLAIIREHNADLAKTWFATVNEFTDWTNEEFRQRRTSRQPRNEDSAVNTAEALSPLVSSESELQLVHSEALPSRVDWRENHGVVTAVKNQGGCGSCWAFSAVETLESHLAIATGKAAPVLSEQQVVSCMKNPKDCGGTGGCAGATQPLAFNYTHSAGITLESDYHYRGLTGTCQKSQIKPVATNDGYVKLKVNDYISLVTAVSTKGPIAISLAAGSIGWQLYGGGVFGSGALAKCGWDQDHGVQLVGYGAEGSNLYWLVRNSWGAGWGESGYIRIKRFGEGKEPCGVDKTPQDGEACAGDVKPRTYCGVCGILGSSSYPTGLRQFEGEVPVVV